MILSLDLSSKCTGWAIFNQHKNLVKQGRIIPDKNIDNAFKIHYIVEEVKKLFTNIDEVIIEDLFYNKFYSFDTVKYLARLSGAILDSWVAYKFKSAIFFTASHARKLIGINGMAQKAEIQLFMLNNYNNISKKEYEEYNLIITQLNMDLKQKILTRNQYRNRMDKISIELEEKYKLGEDEADALVLGLAYFKSIDK